jgi:hypothetical protein
MEVGVAAVHAGDPEAPPLTRPRGKAGRHVAHWSASQGTDYKPPRAVLPSYRPFFIQGAFGTAHWAGTLLMIAGVGLLHRAG